MTPEEVDKLPVGPWRKETRDMGPEHDPRYVVFHHALKAKARVYGEGDYIGYCDSRGRLWHIGELEDGGFYKMPIG